MMNATLPSLFLLLALVVSPLGAYAQELDLMEGVEYEVLSAPLPPLTDTGKVEVVEVFWYGCPLCYRLEPYVEGWLENDMPAEAEFIRLPGTVSPGWLDHARAYYTAVELKLVGEIHRPLLEAIHQAGKKLNTQASLGAFFEEQGIDRELFNRTFRSFSVHTKVNRAKYLSERAGVTGVPTIIVGGRYSTRVDMAGGYDRIFRVVNRLVSMAQSADKG